MTTEERLTEALAKAEARRDELEALVAQQREQITQLSAYVHVLEGRLGQGQP